MTLTSTRVAGRRADSGEAHAGRRRKLAGAGLEQRPDGTASFVLIVHDPDAATGNGTDDILHWMLWNIPAGRDGSARARAARLATRLTARGRSARAVRNYRGPGAPAAGPAHHYIFELFALDAMLDVPAVGASPSQTRAAVLAAMAGHVRGKAAYVGLFRRP